MKRIISGTVAAALLATGAIAQNTNQGSHNPAVSDSAIDPVATPAKGANSFTESQARGRIAKAGYSRISKLKKDDDGVWRGMATHHGKRVNLGLDYKGNVSTK